MQTLKKIWFLLQGSQLPYGETGQKHMNNSIEMIFEYSGGQLELIQHFLEVSSVSWVCTQLGRRKGLGELRGTVSRVSCHQSAIAVVNRCA